MTLTTESDRLQAELKVSRKDYASHKQESKKLVAIMNDKKKKRKELKDMITQKNVRLRDLKKQQTDDKTYNDEFAQFAEGQQAEVTSLQDELDQVTKECQEMVETLNAKKGESSES